METERNAIAADEEPSVISRLEIAVLGSVRFDDVLQGQIHAHGEPGGAHDQAADLHGETVVGEGVVVQHEAADVSDCFYKTAAGEGEGECPGFVSDAEVELGDQEGEEKGEEEGVGGEGREVAIDCVLDAADWGDGITGVDIGVGGHDGLSDRKRCKRCDRGKGTVR